MCCVILIQKIQVLGVWGHELGRMREWLSHTKSRNNVRGERGGSNLLHSSSNLLRGLVNNALQLAAGLVKHLLHLACIATTRVGILACMCMITITIYGQGVASSSLDVACACDFQRFHAYNLEDFGT